MNKEQQIEHEMTRIANKYAPLLFKNTLFEVDHYGASTNQAFIRTVGDWDAEHQAVMEKLLQDKFPGILIARYRNGS